MFRVPKLLPSVLAGFVFLSLSGCGGGSGGPSLAPVEGTVKLDGEPLKNAEVSFEPKDDEAGAPSTGTTDENGYYTLRYTIEKEGASVGEHVVRIRTGITRLDENDNEIQAEEKVPARYNANAEDNPEMNVEVPAGGDEFNFDLTSDGEIVESDDDGGGGCGGGGCGGCTY